MEVFAFIGLCVVIVIFYIIFNELCGFIQRVIVGKYKIKCICKHEYLPHIKWHGGAHGIDYGFKCRKCGKEKTIKTYQNSKNESVF